MDRVPALPSDDEHQRLIHANEQLRTSLEATLEENRELTTERDLLRERLREMAQALRIADEAIASQVELAATQTASSGLTSGVEEDVRAAMEEMQEMADELEEANSGLQHENMELDARIVQRTLEIREVETALRTAEAALRTIADVVPDLLWRADATGHVDWFNARWVRYTGCAAEASTGLGWLECIHPRDQAGMRAKWLAAIVSCEPFQHEARLQSRCGAYRWFLIRAEPLFDGSHNVVRWFVAATDIQDHRTVRDALQRSEDRFRSLIEGMPQLVWRAIDTGIWTWSSRQWTDYTGQTRRDARGLGWLLMLHPDDRAAARAAWERAQADAELDFECRIFHVRENRYRRFRTRARAVRDMSGRVMEWLGTSTDVDDILQLQDEQRVLVAELQHRTRNLMGVVQSITTRTLRSTTSLAEFKERISDRLGALARVQGLLSRRETGIRVAFDLLLREELSAHLDLDAPDLDRKVRLDGPDGIALRSATVQVFALALHELATNAVKYGALSDKGRQLKVAWDIERAGPDHSRLRVDWRETGVDGVTETASSNGKGFGRELIERALPHQLGAKTTYAFEPGGVHCTIEVDVPTPVPM